MISPNELEELANLYDQAAQSLNPTDPRAMQALDEFEAKLERLYLSFRGPGTRPRDFKRAVISQCKASSRKTNRLAASPSARQQRKLSPAADIFC